MRVGAADMKSAVGLAAYYVAALCTVAPYSKYSFAHMK